MKFKEWSQLTVFAACLALGISGCANDDEFNDFSNLNVLGSNFYQVDVNPWYYDEFVDTLTDIRITMSQSIDTQSLVGNINVVETVGSTATDITEDVFISFRTVVIANDSIIIKPSSPLHPSARYTVALGQGVRSAGGAPISGETILEFSTSTFDNVGGGALSVEGPPRVVSSELHLYPGAGHCMAILVRFNEDINTTPIGSYSASSARGSGVYSSGIISGNSVVPQNLRTWYFTLPGGGCFIWDDWQVNALGRLVFNVTDAQDFQSERLNPTYTTHFDGCDYTTLACSIW